MCPHTILLYNTTSDYCTSPIRYFSTFFLHFLHLHQPGVIANILDIRCSKVNDHSVREGKQIRRKSDSQSPGKLAMVPRLPG